MILFISPSVKASPCDFFCPGPKVATIFDTYCIKMKLFSTPVPDWGTPMEIQRKVPNKRPLLAYLSIHRFYFRKRERERESLKWSAFVCMHCVSWGGVRVWQNFPKFQEKFRLLRFCTIGTCGSFFDQFQKCTTRRSRNNSASPLRHLLAKC